MSLWADYYRDKDTPWDVGGPHPELVSRFTKKPTERNALVPGCGFGHDACFLAESGLAVVGLDLVEQLDSTAGAKLRALGGSLHIGDALDWQPEELFDIVFEHTFLCAIEPDLRPKWAALVQRCLKPGGRLLAIAFPGGKAVELGGPPFGYSVGDMADVLGKSFQKTIDEPAQHSVARREWEERWVEFVRND